MLNSQDEQELERNLLEGGKGRALQHLQMKQMIEEEELSEEEIQKQIETNKYYNFMKQKKLQDQMKSMEERHDKMNNEMDEFLVEENARKKPKTI